MKNDLKEKIKGQMVSAAIQSKSRVSSIDFGSLHSTEDYPINIFHKRRSSSIYCYDSTIMVHCSSTRSNFKCFTLVFVQYR